MDNVLMVFLQQFLPFDEFSSLWFFVICLPQVYSNLSIVSGAPDVTVNAEDTAAYTLSISPCRRGVFQGTI